MSVTYFKRFKMEVDLYAVPSVPALPEAYLWVPWEDALLDRHAEVKFGSFHDEIDAAVFPSLGDRNGCLALMQEIRRKTGFLPGATWLLNCAGTFCGTVQGIRDPSGVGSIQNLGVLPAYRGRGLGTALLLKALEGFRSYGLGRAYLEVTAQNASAVQLYRRVGFRCRKTLYKAVDGSALAAFPALIS